MFGFKDARSLNYSPHQNSAGPTQDMDWIFDGAEYDPMWPNDYEKVVKGKLKRQWIEIPVTFAVSHICGITGTNPKITT